MGSSVVAIWVRRLKTFSIFILDEGPSYHVQTAFNALAARERNYGRVTLRLRSKPYDIKKAGKIYKNTIKNLKDKNQLSIEKGNIGSALKILPERAASNFFKALGPRLLGVVNNPVFDLWLTLLDEESARRLRRCKYQECHKFFIAWPRKKEYCSTTCRNCFWTRPQRKSASHKQ